MEYLALIFFVLSTSGTPGPNNVMILTSGVNHGIKKSIPHVLGVNIGFPIMIIAVGLGMMTLFERWPILHQLIQLVGILYLIYLAYKIATMPINNELAPERKPISFLQAALFQWVNPKAWVMAVSAVVAFSISGVEITSQVLVIAAFYCVFGFPCSVAWLFVGKWLKQFFSNQKYLKIFNCLMALLLITSLIPMISSTFIF